MRKFSGTNHDYETSRHCQYLIQQTTRKSIWKRVSLTDIRNQWITENVLSTLLIGMHIDNDRSITHNLLLQGQKDFLVIKVILVSFRFDLNIYVISFHGKCSRILVFSLDISLCSIWKISIVLSAFWKDYYALEQALMQRIIIKLFGPRKVFHLLSLNM